MSTLNPPLSLVIPVYRNEENIPGLLKVLAAMAQQCSGRMEVIFVVDGSPDKSFALLQAALPQATFPSQLLEHSRNFGSFSAIRTGMGAATGKYLAVMAADLQEPPELVLRIFAELEAERADVVFGQRTGRDDPFFASLSSTIFWNLYRRLVIRDIPKGGVDIFGCNRQVCEAILRFKEANSSLIAQLFWVGYRRSFVHYKRNKREHGVSGWSFRKRLIYMLDSVVSFTSFPISLLFWIGTIGVCVSLFIAIIVLLAWTCNAMPIRGYTPLMLAIIFLGSLQLLSSGIIGFYIWRIFENTKCRPASFVKTRMVFTPLGKME